MADNATARAWLAGQGFAEGDLRSEITINNKKRCPMAWASQKGELGVCKWLHENGAAEDVSKANSQGFTPMILACQEGHLSVCKWLFEVGAAVDITKADNGGFTPMRRTFSVPVMHWLVLKGALVEPTSEDEHVVKNLSLIHI